MTQHAQTARTYLASAGEPLDVTESLQQSLIHATLELAEQQRAANLIAYERLHLSRPDAEGQRKPVAIPLNFVVEEIERILDLDGAAQRHEGDL